MGRKNDLATDILMQSAQAMELQIGAPCSPDERYKRIVLKLAGGAERTATLRNYLKALELFVVALGAALGFFLTFTETSKEVQTAAWVGYVIVAMVVGFTAYVLPNSAEHLSLEIDRLRLLTLSERLAAQLALFRMVSQSDHSDNSKFITAASDTLPDLDSLSQEDKGRIRSCITSDSVFTTSRQTNITLTPNLAEPSVQHLASVCKDIAHLSRHLFSGTDFAAKIYLRTRGPLEGHEVEILVSVAKFPAGSRATYNLPNSQFGSSWIKARGNPSIVWRCLETGKPQHEPVGDPDADYRAVYAVCLPGRTGVLAITSPNASAFVNKLDDSLHMALATACGVAVERAFRSLDS